MNKSCLDCQTSVCCKSYPVFITEEDYDRLPEYAKVRVDLDSINTPDHLYGYITKNPEGYCSLIDMDTMLCSVHTVKPKCCCNYEEGFCITDPYLLKLVEI